MNQQELKAFYKARPDLKPHGKLWYRLEAMRVGRGWLAVPGKIGRRCSLPYFQFALSGNHHWPVSFRGYVSRSDRKPVFVWPR